MKEYNIELVQGFRHALPYINAHRGKTFVVMLRGEAIKYNNSIKKSIISYYYIISASVWC